MANSMSLVFIAELGGGTEWNVESVCVPHLLIYMVTSFSQECSERIYSLL